MEAHGDEGDPQQDVDRGEQHPDHVLLLLLPTAQLEPGHPDGGEEGEAVVESVDRADAVIQIRIERLTNTKCQIAKEVQTCDTMRLLLSQGRGR